MLKEKHISYIEKLVLEYKQDAETQFNLMLQEDGVEDEEWKEEIETTTEILMALKAMREMNDSDDIEVLRAENAMLRKILKGVAGNLREIADQASEI